MQASIQPTPTFHELYAQLRHLPDHLRGEILHGKLITSPRPTIRHAHTCGVIASDLIGPFQRRLGGPKGPGGWKRERLPHLPDVAAMTLAPDWVCEVLSPSTARYDRKGKAQAYLYAGVTWQWLVDPKAHTLEVYRREGDLWVHDKVCAEPFDAVMLDLSRWWEEAEETE